MIIIIIIIYRGGGGPVKNSCISHVIPDWTKGL